MVNFESLFPVVLRRQVCLPQNTQQQPGACMVLREKLHSDRLLSPLPCPGRNLQSDAGRPWQRVWSCISTVGFGPGQWFRQLVTLASSQLQQREREGRHDGCGNTHMVMNESCSWGRSRAGGNPAGPHPLTPYACGYAANHWLGVGAFLPTSWRALAVPSG